MDLTVEEARLISVRRAIDKLNQPDLIGTVDASPICAYITGIIDLDTLEEVATEDQLEYFLDGCVLGFIISQLIASKVSLDELPKSEEEKRRQFQTGVDPRSGDVNVNKK